MDEISKQELNKAYYESNVWLHTYYKGIQTLKYPTDMWIYQELIYDTKPDVILEIGTLKGGSALFFADQGLKVITIDIEDVVVAKDPRITYLIGDSTSEKGRTLIQKEINKYKGKKIMVSIDGDHHKDKVFEDIVFHAISHTTVGCYTVVEDTFISEYLDNKDFPAGSSKEAVFMLSNSFEQDSTRDKFLLTMNPGGWFKRVRE